MHGVLAEEHMAEQQHRGLGSALAATMLAVPMVAGAALESADARFYSTDPSGCVTTEVFVLVNRGKLGGPANQADTSEQPSLRISQVDDCKQIPLMNAFGSVQQKGHFKVDNGLASATLYTTIPVFDQVSGRSLEIDVSLAWSATGAAFSTADHIYFQSPGHVVQLKNAVQGTHRPAQASGAVFLDTTNFTPDPSKDAEVSELK
jgi:hypothetical protein